MDSLTHIAVGACIGELVAGKRLGKKAMVIGALAQSIPDADFVTSWWMTVPSDLLAHRGFTHSILFLLLISPILGWCSQKVFPKIGIDRLGWAFIWGIQIFMHLFLDIFNVYGTGLFEPFSHYRVSLNTFFVLDPLFSLWPIMALAALSILKSTYAGRSKIIVAALGMSGLYMVNSVYHKLYIDRAVTKSFELQHLHVERYFTTPTALNNILWYIVAQTDSGYYVGYRSVLDRQPLINYRSVAAQHELLNGIADTTAIGQLKRFSQGYYVASKYNDTLVFNDLRFGEMTAGLQPDPRFSFYYYLQPRLSNDVIIQRGRFCGWDRHVVAAFVQRIMGK